MTLRFVDSFDHYSTADILLKWSASSGTPSIGASGRRSTNAIRLPNNSASPSSVQMTFDNQATWIVGFALSINTTITSSSTQLCALLDAGTQQCELRINADNTLSVTRNATVLGTSVSPVSTGGFNYIEFKVTISDAGGAYEVRVNGANVLSASSVDTKNTSNASANIVRIGTTSTLSGGSTVVFEDLYICDGSGSVNNNFLGDVRVDCYMPNGNGNSSQLVGSDGNSTDNYLLVDEASQNGDTDYVQSATVNQKDTYAITDIAHTPTSIFGTQLNIIAKKDDSGTRSICAVCRSGGTDYDGDTQALSTSYLDYRQVREVDPATSAAWTKTNLNAAEFGVKVAV
jgi:hypothetical protein